MSAKEEFIFIFIDVFTGVSLLRVAETELWTLEGVLLSEALIWPFPYDADMAKLC